MAQFGDGHRTTAWLYSVLRNIAIDRLRRKKMEADHASAQPTAGSAVERSSERSASILVQVNGRYAIALMLDGVVLCIVPVGSETTTSV